MDTKNPCDWGICPRGPGVKESEEIIDLGDGSHGRPRVIAGCFLLDRYDRAQTVDALDFGFLKDTHEMLGIGRESVHVTSLAFSVDRVESQGGFSAAAQSGHHDKLVSWDVHIDSGEVVGLRATYLYVFLIIVTHQLQR